MTSEEVAVKIAEHHKEIDNLEHRVSDCEEQQKTMNRLVSAVDKLATNMDHMLSEQKEQGQRLLKLEQEPADNYRYYKRSIGSEIMKLLCGGVIGAILALIIK